MRLTNTITAAVACLLPLTEAAKLTVSIPPSPPLLPNPASLPASTHATLLGSTGQHYDARLTRSNALVFKDIVPGSYLLDVHSRDYIFQPFRVDVAFGEAGADKTEGQELIQVWQTFMGNDWTNVGPSFGEQRGELTITVSPKAKKNYYEQKEGFNLLNFFKNPMILMGLFSVVMIFGMPYLMENMDPETKAEFEEMQKKSPLTGSEGAAASIQNFDLASWMAGKSNDAGGNTKAVTGNAKVKR